MATQGNTSFSATDRPRVSAKSVKTMSSTPNLQYRQSGVKTYNAKQPRNMGRTLGRS